MNALQSGLFQSGLSRHAPRTAALLLVAVVASYVPTVANAEDYGRPGRVEFDYPDARPANIEVDLKHGMLSALTNIVTAAVEGMSDGLNESGLRESGRGDAIRESTDILMAVREILGISSDVVHEIRVRIHQGNESNEGLSRDRMVEHYRQKLLERDWENTVRFRDGSESVAVCVRRQESTIHGIFVMVSDGDELVLANVVCELTPDRIRQLTNRATKIGLKFGLADAIEEAMRDLSGGK